MGLENHVSPGRARKFSKRDERKMVITIKRNPFLTAKELEIACQMLKKFQYGRLGGT